MKKQRRENIRRAGQIISAAALSAALFLAPAAPVFAGDVTDSSSYAEQVEDNDKMITITIHYGNTTKKVPALRTELESGEWDTYSDGPNDYDRDTTRGSDTEIYYVPHADQDLTATVHFVDEATGAEIQKPSGSEDTFVVKADDSDSFYPAPREFTVGGKTYQAVDDNPDIHVKYSSSPVLNFTISYKETTPDPENYTVLVKYVDADNGAVISSRTFKVAGRDHIFYAPTTLSIERDGQKNFYEIAKKGSNRIDHEVKSSKREYTIEYKKSEADYTWYIVYCDSSNNAKLGTESVEVTTANDASNPQSHTPDLTRTFNGKNYTLNAAFTENGVSKALKHVYGKDSRMSYVFYDPEGYDTTTEHTRQITIQYRDVTSTSVLKEEKVTVSDKKDTQYTVNKANIAANDTEYAICRGQSEALSLSYFPLDRTTYIIYFYDVNDKNFDQAPVITREEVVTTTVNDGPTTYTIVPGITTVTATDESTGRTVNVGAEGLNGARIDTSGAVNSSNGTDGSANGAAGNGTEAGADNADQSANGQNSADNQADVSIDGVQADEIQTPQGNIQLNKKQNNTSRNLIIGLGLAVLAIVALYCVILYRRRKAADMGATMKRKQKFDHDKK